MKKILIILLLIGVTGSYANTESDRCEQRHGNWEWNGIINEWQCLNTTITDDNMSDIVASTNPNEENKSQTESTWSRNSIGKKALIIVAVPVVVVGMVVTAIVVVPVALAKTIFSSK
jgi:hypothetical protein